MDISDGTLSCSVDNSGLTDLQKKRKWKKREKKKETSEMKAGIKLKTRLKSLS